MANHQNRLPEVDPWIIDNLETIMPQVIAQEYHNVFYKPRIERHIIVTVVKAVKVLNIITDKIVEAARSEG